MNAALERWISGSREDPGREGRRGRKGRRGKRRKGVEKGRREREGGEEGGGSGTRDVYRKGDQLNKSTE